jgi:hypothetical protein
MKALWLALCFGLLALTPTDSFSPVREEESGLLSAVAAAQGWTIAFIRENQLYVQQVRDPQPTLIAKDASHPVWSSDGSLLAFRRRSKLFIWNARTTRIVQLADDLPEFEPWARASRMTFDPRSGSLVVGDERGLRVYDLKKPGAYAVILAGGRWITDNPAWDAAGVNMAFTRNGDIWIALRGDQDHGQWKVRGGTEGTYIHYYEDARRLAPLAVWNDGEIGCSARTPFWVDDLEWTPDGKRLVFHYQRQGGSGISQVGYLDLEPAGESEDWDDASGFRVKTVWLTGPNDLFFNPRICPDGETLSFVNNTGELFLCDWSGSQMVKVLNDVDQFAWRPQQ